MRALPTPAPTGGIPAGRRAVLAWVASQPAFRVAAFAVLYRELADRRYDGPAALAAEIAEGHTPPLSIIAVQGIVKATEADWDAARVVQRLDSTFDLRIRLAAREIGRIAETAPLRAEAVLHAIQSVGQASEDVRDDFDALGLVGAPWATEALARWDRVEENKDLMWRMGIATTPSELRASPDPDCRWLADFAEAGTAWAASIDRPAEDPS